MKTFFPFLLLLLSLNAFSETSGIKKYQQMLLDHAEILSDYPEGAVFLKKTPSPWDTLWIRANEGDVVGGTPCSGRSELKSTILLSGFKAGNVFLDSLNVEEYYLLEEKTVWFDKSASNFEQCKNYFGSEAPTIKKIYLKKKKRITLLSFKNLFEERIYKVTTLDKNRVKLILEPKVIMEVGIYCGPSWWNPNHSNKKVGDHFDRVEVTLDLNRPWEFAEELLISNIGDPEDFFWERKRLPDVNPMDLYEKIKDVEVDLGIYSYPLTGACREISGFPIKKWKDIINWRPPWPGGQ